MGPILGYPQPGKKFIVNMEARSVGSGGVQVQKGQEHVITYYSKRQQLEMTI
jgi:hypothetical protein